MSLPASWMSVLGDQFDQPYFRELERFIAFERTAHRVFPPHERVYSAFDLTPFDRVRVVVLGQDPYHDDGQAHGLCFSVRPGVKAPASLRNIFRELRDDMAVVIPKHGCLASWACQGVLLLNTVLTVRAHEANSHRGKGWESFTDAVISRLSERSEPIVFVLWGKPAQSKKNLIDASRHVLLEAAHPSPLSARNGFFGSKPFSKINQALRSWGKPEIDWAIPDHLEVP